MKINPLTFLLTVIATLLICIAPKYTRLKGVAAKSKAMSHLKSIGLAMREFETQYGHRPQPGTAIDFPTPYPQQDREDANTLLGQLIAAGMVDTEKIFTLNSGKYSPEQADDLIYPASEILKPGENHFTYITCKNGTGEQPTSSALPLIISHFVPGTSRIDREIFGREAAYLKLDTSVRTCRARDGKALLKGQGNLGLLDNGPDTVWGDWEPQLHHPLPFEQTLTQRSLSLHPFSKFLYPIFLYLLFRIVITAWKWRSENQSST